MLIVASLYRYMSALFLAALAAQSPDLGRPRRGGDGAGHHGTLAALAVVFGDLQAAPRVANPRRLAFPFLGLALAATAVVVLMVVG